MKNSDNKVNKEKQVSRMGEGGMRGTGQNEEEEVIRRKRVGGRVGGRRGGEGR